MTISITSLATYSPSKRTIKKEQYIVFYNTFITLGNLFIVAITPNTRIGDRDRSYPKDVNCSKPPKQLGTLVHRRIHVLAIIKKISI